MNKRQRKKYGLLNSKIEIGSRVIIVKDTSFGHKAGTIGKVTDKNKNGNYIILAPYQYAKNVGTIPLIHDIRDLKKLKNKKMLRFKRG